jgi:hypothetical protein
VEATGIAEGELTHKKAPEGLAMLFLDVFA